MNKFPSAQNKSDTILLLATLLLLTAGITMIYSSSSILAMERFKDGQYFLKRQFFYIMLGLVVMMILRKTPYRLLGRWSYLGLFLSVVLLLLLFVPPLGLKVNSATRWLKIGFFTFQVTEPVKVAMVIFLAHYLTRKDAKPQEFTKGFLIQIGRASCRERCRSRWAPYH